MRIRVFLYLLIFITSICFFSNTDRFYIGLGNIFYKYNIKKAQKFYEMSFALGNKNTNARDIYVTSLITSFPNIEEQEKLVKFAEGKVQDKAAIKAKQYLYDIKREIHSQYPNNYIQQAPFNQQIVHWSNFPITYSFSKESVDVPEIYIDEINKAFSQWEKDGNIKFSEISEKSNIVIHFIHNRNINMEYGRKYVIAYTIPDISGNILQCMHINFYINNPEGGYFTRSQIYNTALHEIFHALGFMGHSLEQGNIMYLSKDNYRYMNSMRAELSAADINTLKLLYNTKPDITNHGNINVKYLPYLVIGNDKERNFSKVKEAKRYISHAPTLPSGYIDLAESLVAQKRYPEAIKNLDKALELSDTSEMQYIVYYNLAITYNLINHKEMAIDYVTKAMAIKNTAELHELKAEILKNYNNNLAKNEYKYLIQTSPENPKYIIKLANLYIKECDYLAARKVLKSFLQKHPEFKKDKRFSSYGILIF